MKVNPRALVLSSALMLAGCEKRLLSPTDERSPYERYEVVRSQYADQSIADAFGRLRPNLRERLLPKD